MATGTEVIVVLVILGAVLVIIANRKGNDVIVSPMSVSLTMEPMTSAAVQAHLMYTPFPRWFRKARRTQGTVSITNPGSIVSVVPTGNIGTSHTAPAVFTVTAVLVGVGALAVDGKSRHGNHDSAIVRYTVTRT